MYVCTYYVLVEIVWCVVVKKSARASLRRTRSLVPNGTLFKPKEETKLALFLRTVLRRICTSNARPRDARFLTQKISFVLLCFTTLERLPKVASLELASRRKWSSFSFCILEDLIDRLIELLILQFPSVCLPETRRTLHQNCFSIEFFENKKSVIHLWRRLLTRL